MGCGTTRLYRTVRRALYLELAAVVCGAGALVAQRYGAPYGEVERAAEAYRGAAAASRDLIAAHMDERGVPGLSVAVAVNGDIVWSEGFGYANVEHRIPVTTVTRFRSGSIAKPVGAAAMGKLLDAERFELDVPIQHYVPSFPDKGHVITPRQLAGHLAGIRYYKEGGDEFFNTTRHTDVLEGLAVFQDDPLLHEPGTEYFYSSYGSNLLGAAIQAAAGKPYLEVLREHVFEPLRMRMTTGDFSDSIIPNRTGYYERTGMTPSFFQKPSSWGDGTELGVLLNGPFADNSNKWPGGGLITTPEDLARFGSAHLEPGYLSAETLELLFTRQRTTDGEETPYGMNWFIDADEKGRRVLHHGGGSVGGSSFLLLYPEERVVVAVQCNLTRASDQPMYFAIADLFIAARPTDR